ncbi:MAG: SusC/RagA family TonB-linked outer membrane protein, partial [Odoribacter sp.]|nr:SusC/RagA family TonB-linked outer membrane protein [Odoribacter sp.]
MRCAIAKKATLYLCLALTALCIVPISGYGTDYCVFQDVQKRVTVSLTNATLEQILSEINRQTGVNYGFQSNGKVDKNRPFTLQVKNVTVEEALRTLLTDSPYTFIYEKNRIVIASREDNGMQAPQSVKVSGKVGDEKGQPLPGVTIIIKGTTVGTATDMDGRYSMTLPGNGENVVLVYSFVGMKEKEVAYKGQEEVNVVLVPAVEEMDEVIVTGIFTKAKESYTGAVTTITEKELKAAGNRSVLSSIRNMDPSFNIVEDLEYGSDPNRLPDVTMRGRTSMDVNVRDLQEDANTQSSANLPLFILDGFEVSLQRVMDMDQELVASITLLKDASATALYGSRGANGIVVITSKRPEPGKLRVSYRGTVNIEAPDFSSYNLMDAAEKLEYERLANLYSSPYNDTRLKFEQLYNQRKIDVERGVNTYWLKYPVRTAVGSRHSLRLDGGADNFNYGVTLSYNNVAGVMKKSARNTLSGNFFLQYEYKNLKFQNDFTVSYNKNYNSPYGSFSEYATMSSLYTPYNEDGSLKKMLSEETIAMNTPQITGNPLYNASLPSRNDGRYTNLQNNFAIEWYVLPEFFVRARVGLTKQDDRSDVYLSRDHTSFETDYYTGDNYKLRGSYVFSTAYYFAYEGDVTLNYNKTFGDKHSLYAGFSFNFADDKTENYGFTAQGFSALNKDNIGMASSYAVDSRPTSSEDHSRRFGSILNFNYIYNHRYFVDFSGKLEGSSKFGSNDRIAPFWSVGLGWNLHNENFLANQQTIDNLRLKVSYGTTGSQNFSPYQALTTYRYFTNQTYEYWTGAYMIGLGNPDLTWQKTKQANVGLETMLFNGRVRLNVDWYNKLTEALLTDINLPTAAGFGSYKANVGKVRNQGVEL